MSEATAPAEPLSQSFLDQVQRIAALNVFARAFPLWVKAHNGKTLAITFTAMPDGQVDVDLRMPTDSQEEDAQELFDLLEKSQRLADLQVLVQELRRIGAAPAQIQNYTLEGDSLLRQLYPDLVSLSAPTQK
jgi:hypothetical protein